MIIPHRLRLGTKKETQQILSLYLKFAKRKLFKFIKKHCPHYKIICSYFRRGEEERALKYACQKNRCNFYPLPSKKSFDKYSNRFYDDMDQILIEKECLKDLYAGLNNLYRILDQEGEKLDEKSKSRKSI